MITALLIFIILLAIINLCALATIVANQAKIFTAISQLARLLAEHYGS